MLFTRTHTYHFQVPKNELVSRLVGKHVKIHNLDFEVYENEGTLTIMPHAEQVNAIKTLPVTTISLTESNKKTKIVVTSRMRPLDKGGPYLIVIFCTFLLIASAILLYVGGDSGITYTLLTACVTIFAIFLIRLELGYGDYVRKIRAYVKEKVSPSMPSNVSVA